MSETKRNTFDPNPDLVDQFVEICDLWKPVGDVISGWKTQMTAKMEAANLHEKEYLAKYYPDNEFVAYSYEDLIPGLNVECNLMALHRFYNKGYRFYRPLMMWYFENGMVQHFLNAAKTIYYCDRDHPYFEQIVSRAAEIGDIHPNMFVIAIYQYFNWSTFDGNISVLVNLPKRPEKIIEFLRANLVQSSKDDKFVISYDIVIPSDVIKDELDEFDEFDITANRFEKALNELILEYDQSLYDLLVPKNN